MDHRRTVYSLSLALGIVACAASSGCDLLGPSSRAPEAIGSIPGQELVAGDASAVELSSYFEDSDGDTLAYEAATSDAGVARAPVAGSVVTVEGVGGGTATVTVAASDPGGLSAEQRFEVRVIPRSDRTALAALYHATDGPNWSRDDFWLTDAPLWKWYGVESDGGGRVVALLLAENNLSGSIPSEVGELSKLRSLRLNDNALKGPIPPELGDLSALVWLDLGRNEPLGPIPPELGKLSNLESMNFGGTLLGGPIPPELGDLSNLRRLSLFVNGLTGSIPSELGKLAKLEELVLVGNRLLNGSIPPELGGLKSVKRIVLDWNRLSGPLPPELGHLESLEALSILWNRISGELPAELGNLSTLKDLRLDFNRISGTIPPELANLSNLEWLVLNDNELTGPVPPELGRLSNLRGLFISDNGLTGTVPPELGDLSNLRSLYLSDNGLTGTIPKDLLRLSRLETLRFETNGGLCIPGTIVFASWLKGMDSYKGPFCNASDIVALRALYRAAGGEEWTNSGGWLGDAALGEWYGVSADHLGRVTGLDLSGNGLVGRLLPTLGRLSEMRVLKIGGNALTGPLPLSMVDLTLREFRYADTELCTLADDAFREWLKSIDIHEGTGVECE